MQNEILCSNCKNPIYINIDSYGRTPFHLHCNTCKINIGSTSIEKCIELFKKYHKPNTMIEYYSNEIKLLFEEGKCVLCRMI